ncbi:MAG: cytochrome c biogenesis protein CcsA [Myxococcota bacterium]
MVVTLQYLTAALYAAAGLVGWAGFARSQERLAHVAVAALGFGAVCHGLSFSLLHTLDPPPPLTHLPSALSFMAWVGTVGFLWLVWRARLAGLVVLVAPMSWVGVLPVLLAGPVGEGAAVTSSGSLPHLHVLLSSAGLALLGLSGLAGVLFLLEHGRLKRKRPVAHQSPWPSLEALDRAGAVAVAAGFPVLTAGVVTGALWLHADRSVYFSGSPHEVFCLIGWALFGVLASLRFGVRIPARQCARVAVACFACLCCAVVGTELFA